MGVWGSSPTPSGAHAAPGGQTDYRTTRGGEGVGAWVGASSQSIRVSLLDEKMVAIGQKGELSCCTMLRPGHFADKVNVALPAQCLGLPK